MPKIATRFALPREYEQAGVRRYGFHGLSYEYIAGRLREVAADLANSRVIVAHLGNGASVCGMLADRSCGRSIKLTRVQMTCGFSCCQLDNFRRDLFLAHHALCRLKR